MSFSSMTSISGGRIHLEFREVALRHTKRGPCTGCGKTAIITRKFWQTLNPFNKGAHGHPKTEQEIRTELRAEAKAWDSEPLYHAKCRPHS